MKKHLFCFTVLFVFLLNTSYQAQDWVTKHYDWLNSVCFVNSTTGWVVGDRGKILKTTDGGTIWFTQNSGTTQQLESVFFLNSLTGFICGEAGQIRKTTDGGNTWLDRNLGLSQICHSLYFISENVGWVGTYYGIYKTTDSGLSWVVQYYQTRVRSIYFTDENHGWAAFEIGVFKRTTDGGENWLDASSLTTGTFMCVQFTDNNNGWISGHADCLRKTTDGGINWTNIDNGFSGYGYFMVKFINNSTGWLVGTSGIVLKTTDGGGTWSQQSTNVPYDLRAISIVGTDGWICGVGGIILKNGSANPLPVELSSFTIKEIGGGIQLNWTTETETNNYGFEIERKTTDSWLKVSFVEGYGNSNSPRTYLFTDENPVGGNKFYYRLKQIDTDGLFKYSDIVEVNLTPTEFALYQNYPNPFNPNTTIKYQTPRECSVSIKVYDLLGAEILELLNEKKEPGIYEIEFNAAFLPSGVYLYKLTDGHFTDSKKMLLLK